MTATDELRRMLDELNIKHFDYSKGGWTQTQWEAPDGNRHFTYETYNNPAKTAKLVISWFPTPEQAVEATLGRGTCRIAVQDNLAETDGMGDVWLECDACHWQMPLEPSTPRFNYCPNCGREVVEQ